MTLRLAIQFAKLWRAIHLARQDSDVCPCSECSFNSAIEVQYHAHKALEKFVGKLAEDDAAEREALRL